MAKTLNLGERVELLPMDDHCHDISLGLYRQDVDGDAQFLVHTYSSVSGCEDRVAYITKALEVMLGLEAVPNAAGKLRFPCGSPHLRALKRSFLDLCKLETGAPLEPKPLTGFDKKAAGNLTVVNSGGGNYTMTAEEGLDAGPKRAKALAKGYAKICEMEPIGDDGVAFPCGTGHDALLGMLFYRAQNVRAAMQEEESAASRGSLSAPSQQK